MSSEIPASQTAAARSAPVPAVVANHITALRNYHTGRIGLVVWPICLTVLLAVMGAGRLTIDEMARTRGEVIALSRVQVIQAVDGGVVAQLNVREGDKVVRGQILASFDQGRLEAEVGQVAARLAGLRIRSARLKAEVTAADHVSFDDDLARDHSDLVTVETALFDQRRRNLSDETQTTRTAVQLARDEAAMIDSLVASGDANEAETLKARRALNEAEAALGKVRNGFLEQVQTELSKTEDEIGQTLQELNQRQEQLDASVFRAQTPGIVKNVRVTTIGGVVRAGEEIMQIIPTGDDLVIEAKVLPTDISRVSVGQKAAIRLDPYDSSIFGAVDGDVIYVSADTMKDEGGENAGEPYYRIHVRPLSNQTETGLKVEILPGMTAQVDVKAGERTLLAYLLKPLRKTMSDALRER